MHSFPGVPDGDAGMKTVPFPTPDGSGAVMGSVLGVVDRMRISVCGCQVVDMGYIV